jgi:ubiquinone/menaquinone biosynthesis C-methylase UbiE
MRAERGRLCTVIEPDQYFLGYRHAEQDRLQRQALELADDSAWLFARVGLSSGQSVVEVGCGPRGCLDLLAALVGPTGTVTGIESSDEAVTRAREYVAAQGLHNVDVRVGDGRATGLDRNAFDVVTTRLVLVNVPQPEEFVAEAVAITRPGGVVAYHEVTWPLHILDPPPRRLGSPLGDLSRLRRPSRPGLLHRPTHRPFAARPWTG